MIELALLRSRMLDVVANEHYQLFVPIDWYGEAGYFKIDTGSRLDLSLSGAGLRSGQLPRVRDRGSFAVHVCQDITILGRDRPAGEITTFESSPEGNVLGSIGSPFFAGGALILDPAGPFAASSDHWEDLLPGVEPSSVRMEGHSELPLTRDIRIAEIKGPIVVLLDSGSERSYVVGSAIPEAKRWAGTRTLTVASPSGGEHSVVADVREDGPSYAVDIGATIQVVLGADYLRAHLTVFDYSRRRVYFMSYG